MMNFTDIFIERPVLAIVLSALITVLGLRSIGILPIQQYPSTENAVITISTSYTGADPEIVAGFITTPLENSVAQANGIDYMTSTSTQGASTIQLNLLLNYDPGTALSYVTTLITAVLNQLPPQSQQPVISVSIGETIDSMYIGFYSDVLPNNKITDYLIRVAQPKLQAVIGVQNAQILGQRQFAMRAWLDPKKLAAYQLTPADIAKALADNDFITAAGRTNGQMFTLDLTANTDLRNVDQFRKLILKYQNGAFVRLSDVANVSLGSTNYNTSVSFDGQSAVYIGILVEPSANLLSVLNNVKKIMPQIQAELPQGLKAQIVYDASEFVSSSIKEVIASLTEAFLIVAFVIFLFLGSIRSVMIPLIAIPLSIIGTFFMMFILGYTINLLTLLALVLAIGLVVDDAIIVVENTHRHIEEGTSPLQSAIISARELSSPIIAISVVLIAVFVPIGFMGGLTGALFTEFAFTLAGSVGISAIVALTLSPMMCSRFLKKINHTKRGLTHYIDFCFDKLQHGYQRTLSHALNYLSVVIVFAIIILTSNYFLFLDSKSELAPQEDQGIILGQLTTDANSNLQQTELFSNEVDRIFRTFPETYHTFAVNGVGTIGNALNASFNGMVLKPWDQRKRTSNQLQPIVQQQLNNVSGAKIAAFQLPSLPGGGSGLPIQFVIKTTDDFNKINEVLQNFLQKAYATGMFVYIDPDLKIDKVQTEIQIDRDKASELGFTMQDIGNSLTSALSENYINYFDYMGRSYQVIPQTVRQERLNASQLKHYYVTAQNGTAVPLSTFVKLKNRVVPESLNHFQQLNSTTISAIAAPGVSMGDALSALQKIGNEVFPQGYTADYAAQSRQYIQEGASLIATFFFGLIIIFLTLAAQFNSFRDPFTVLISVPMSICGAMIFICLGTGGATLNIYTEVGLITLIGLISKHGILIVQFANEIQKQGKDKREAVETAAAIRLRPILMTTAAMVLGVVPLILATGAGAVSRYNIGLVIATGISIGTMFTLFVVPAMYLILAEDHQPGKHAEQLSGS